jgi:FkbM family methyltransferase
MRLHSRRRRFGALQSDLPFLKDVIDYRLTKFPGLYLLIERFRSWVNWDKRVYLFFVRRGDIVLDVGANVGAHSVFFSHLVGRQGRVLAFEPLPPNLDALRKTVHRRLRTPNVSIIERAVGNPRSPHQTVVIRAPADDLTQASLQVQQAGSWRANGNLRQFSVSLTSLDAEGEVQKLPRIDFVKIDVEGGELDVLKGATRILQKHHPLVYCEAYEEWAAPFGYTPDDLFRIMAALGYNGARAISRGIVVPAVVQQRVPPGLFDTASNVLFFAEKHSDIIAAFDKRYIR